MASGAQRDAEGRTLDIPSARVQGGKPWPPEAGSGS
jgi:hypothetical protein